VGAGRVWSFCLPTGLRSEEPGVEDPGRPIGNEATYGDHQETECIGNGPHERITTDCRVPDILDRPRYSIGISHFTAQHMSSRASAIVHPANHQLIIGRAPISDTRLWICAVFSEREL